MKENKGSKRILRRACACLLSVVLLASMLALPADAANSFKQDNDYLDWLSIDHEVIKVEWEQDAIYSLIFGNVAIYKPVIYVPIGTLIEVKGLDNFSVCDEIETELDVYYENGIKYIDEDSLLDYLDNHSFSRCFVSSKERKQYGILDWSDGGIGFNTDATINFDYCFYVVGVDTNVSQGTNGYSISGLEDYVTFSAPYTEACYDYYYDISTSGLKDIIVYEYPVGTKVSLTEKAIGKGYHILDTNDYEEKTSLTLTAANRIRKEYLIHSDRDSREIKLFLRPVNQNLTFDDVKAGSYYDNAVKWAVKYGITNGTSAKTFSPNSTCTTGQIITFFWRACGAVDFSVLDNPFTDISESNYYYSAAIWAEAMGVVSGTKFNANTPCTRSAVVTYLWRFYGKPSVEVTNKFTDVPANADYAQAVAWAVEMGITSGTSATTFSPNETCTRAQIVTFLHRALTW